MTNVKYRSPAGETTEIPSVETLVRLLAQAPESYWQEGSGDAAVYYKRGSDTSMLLLFKKEPFGFHVEYFARLGRHDHYLSVGSGVMSELVTIYVGGEPHKLPTGVFISSEAAQAAVEEFFRTGQRTDKVVWKNRRELSWDDGSEEDC